MLSSAGRRVSLLRLFRDSVEPHGGRVHAADMSPNAAAMIEADHAHVVPGIASDEFVDTMLDLVARNDIGLLVPTIDTELGVLAEHREAFAAAGCHVSVSDPATIAIAADKTATHRWLVQSGHPTVDQATVAEVRADLRNGSRSWELPLIAKPARGSASVGVRRLESFDELDDLADDLLVQTVARGRELTVDVYVDGDGRALCAVPRERLEVRAGEVSKAVTVDHRGAQDLALSVCASLPGARGVLNVQMFADGDDLAVIEINPRFGGGYPLSWQAGARFPEWLVAERHGQRPVVSGWEPGLLMTRYDDALFAHVGCRR